MVSWPFFRVMADTSWLNPSLTWQRKSWKWNPKAWKKCWFQSSFLLVCHVVFSRFCCCCSDLPTKNTNTLISLFCLPSVEKYITSIIILYQHMLKVGCCVLGWVPVLYVHPFYLQIQRRREDIWKHNWHTECDQMVVSVWGANEADCTDSSGPLSMAVFLHRWRWCLWNERMRGIHREGFIAGFGESRVFGSVIHVREHEI